MTDLLTRARAKGTDKQFREWVQRQPSCLSGRFSEWVNGEGRCIAAHVRRAGESGTAFKAPYACVPLTRDEHDLQHQQGELQSLLTHGDQHSIHATREFAREWFDEKRIEYLERWVNE